MWVRGQNTGKNKEKCVNEAIVPDNGRGKDCSSNGLGDAFEDLWFKDLVHTQAI